MNPVQVIYLLILSVVFVIGMVRYKRLTIPFKIVTFAVLATLLSEILSKFFAFWYKNNASIYHFISVIDYIFYATAYVSLFKEKVIKKAIIISIILIIIFFPINILYIQPPTDKVFPTYIYLITNALYVIFSLLLFKQMLQYPLDLNITKQSAFWFNIAILIFSTTMFLNMGLLNYYATHKWGYDIIYYFWQGNFCLFNALIGVSLLTDNKQSVTDYGR